MEIEFQCVENDYKRFYKLYYKNGLQKRFFFIILVPLFTGFQFAGQPFQLTRFIFSAIISELLFVGIFCLIPYLISINKIKKLIRNEPRYLEKKKLRITDEGLCFETATRNGTWKWESIVSFDSNVEFISFFFVDKRLYLIPKRAFTSDYEATNFLGVVQSKIIKYREIAKYTTVLAKKKPPYLLGLLCLIPLIGAFVGLVFVILGIIRFKDKWFTLIGVFGILFTIIIYTTLFYVGNHTSYFKNGFREMSQIELNNLVKDIEFYKIKNGQYPDSLQQLTISSVFINDPIESNQESTNHLFNYLKVDDKYRLFSSGEDGIPNTKDDLYPQVSNKVINKIGLIKYEIKSETVNQKIKESANR